MPEALVPRPMQGKGFYNQHSRGQRDAEQMGVPAFVDACRWTVGVIVVERSG